MGRIFLQKFWIFLIWNNTFKFQLWELTIADEICVLGMFLLLGNSHNSYFKGTLYIKYI